jgi:type III restriction enzyme
VNDKRIKDLSQVNKIDSYISSRTFTVALRTGRSTTNLLFEDRDDSNGIRIEYTNKTIRELNPGIVRKAMNRNRFFNFRNLQKYFPNLKSLDEFAISLDYLAGVGLELRMDAVRSSRLSAAEQLEICDSVLAQISDRMLGNNAEFEGSEQFVEHRIDSTFTEKVQTIAIDQGGTQELGISIKDKKRGAVFLDVMKCDWFVYDDFFGTSEEKHFLKYFETVYPEILARYSTAYLIRNERNFKIYNFSDGTATQPDFVLFLEEKDTRGNWKQVFIEPKGAHLAQIDAWKEAFLVDVKQKAKLSSNQILEVAGLPFYNLQSEAQFDKAFRALLSL